MSTEHIANNLTRLRGSISQKKLADMMKERGYNWVQSTVWSVENNKRDLKLDEGIDLAEILGVKVEALVTPGFENEGERLLDREREKLREAWEGAVEAINNLHKKRLTYGSAAAATLTPEQAGRVFSLSVQLFNEQYAELTLNSCLTEVFGQDKGKRLPYSERESEALARIGLEKIADFDELNKDLWADPWSKVLDRIEEQI